jgi:hypothetical protein
MFSRFLLRFTVYLRSQVFDDDLQRKDEKIWWVYLEILRESSLMFLVDDLLLRTEKQTGELPLLLLWFESFRSFFFSPLTVIVRSVLELQWLGFDDDDSVESLRTTLKLVAIDCCFLILEIRVWMFVLDLILRFWLFCDGSTWNYCELMCSDAGLMRIWCELSSVRVGIGDEHSWCSYQFLEIFGVWSLGDERENGLVFVELAKSEWDCDDWDLL